MAENNKLYRVTIGSKSQMWDQDKLDRNYDKLKSSYPDSKVEEATPSGHKVRVGSKNYESDWDNERYDSNFAKLKEKYPDAEDETIYSYSPYTRQAAVDDGIDIDKEFASGKKTEEPYVPSGYEKHDFSLGKADGKTFGDGEYNVGEKVEAANERIQAKAAENDAKKEESEPQQQEAEPYTPSGYQRQDFSIENADGKNFMEGGENNVQSQIENAKENAETGEQKPSKIEGYNGPVIDSEDENTAKEQYRAVREYTEKSAQQINEYDAKLNSIDEQVGKLTTSYAEKEKSLKDILAKYTTVDAEGNETISPLSPEDYSVAAQLQSEMNAIGAQVQQLNAEYESVREKYNVTVEDYKNNPLVKANDNRERISELKKQIKELRKQIPAFGIVGKDDFEKSERLRALEAERDALMAENRKNPYVRLADSSFSDDITEKKKGLVDLKEKYGIGTQLVPYAGAIPSYEKREGLTPEEQEQARYNIEAAQRIYDKAQEVINRPYRGEGGFFEGAANRALSPDFFTLGLSEISDNKAVIDAYTKMNEGVELTEAEQAVVDAYVDYQYANAQRAYDTSHLYQGGQGAMDMAMLTLEMSATSALGGKALSEAMKRQLMKMMKPLMSRVAASAVAGTAAVGGRKAAQFAGKEAAEWVISDMAGLGQTLVFVAATPSALRTTTELALPDAEGNMKPMADAAKEGFFHEIMMQQFLQAPQRLLRGANDAVRVVGYAKKSERINKWYRDFVKSRAHAGSGANAATYWATSLLGPYAFVKQAAFDQLNSNFDSIPGGDKDALANFFDGDNLAPLLISLIPGQIKGLLQRSANTMDWKAEKEKFAKRLFEADSDLIGEFGDIFGADETASRLILDAIHSADVRMYVEKAGEENPYRKHMSEIGKAYGEASARYEAARKALNEAIEKGASPEEVGKAKIEFDAAEKAFKEIDADYSTNAIMSILSNLAKTAENNPQLRGMLDSVIQNIRSVDRSQALSIVRSIYNAMEATQAYHAFDGSYKGYQQQLRDLKRQEILDSMNAPEGGKFWLDYTEGGVTKKAVIIAQLADGREVFVINPTPNANGEIAAVEEGNSKMIFVKPEQLRASQGTGSEVALKGAPGVNDGQMNFRTVLLDEYLEMRVIADGNTNAFERIGEGNGASEENPAQTDVQEMQQRDIDRRTTDGANAILSTLVKDNKLHKGMTEAHVKEGTYDPETGKLTVAGTDAEGNYIEFDTTIDGLASAARGEAKDAEASGLAPAQPATPSPTSEAAPASTPEAKPATATPATDAELYEKYKGRIGEEIGTYQGEEGAVIARVDPDGITIDTDNGTHKLSWNEVYNNLEAPTPANNAAVENAQAEAPAAPVEAPSAPEEAGTEAPKYELPRTAEGDIDFDRLIEENPEEFYYQYSQVAGREEAKAGLEARMKDLEDKKNASTSFNDRIKIGKDIDVVKAVIDKISAPEQKPKPAQSAAPKVERPKDEELGPDFHVITDRFDGAQKKVGRPKSFYTPSGKKLKGYYVLIEADGVTASHDPFNNYVPSVGFPSSGGQVSNSRDYTKIGNIQATEGMAQNYNGKALQDAPIVSADGVVMSGNGRTIAGQIAAKNGTDSEYLADLRDSIEEYGFSAEDLEGFSHPRVVIVLDEPIKYDVATFDEFNASDQKRTGKAEAANKFGRILNLESNRDIVESIAAEISQYETMSDFNANAKSVKAVFDLLKNAGIVSGLDAETLINSKDGTATEDFKNLLNKIFLGIALDKDAIESVLEADGMGKYGEKIVMSMIELLKSSSLSDAYNLRQDVSDALKLIQSARALFRTDTKTADSQKVVEYLSSRSLIAEDDAKKFEIASVASQQVAFAISSLGPKKFKDFLAAYNDYVANFETEKVGESMFSDEKAPTKEEALEGAIKTQTDKQPVIVENNGTEQQPAAPAEQGGAPAEGNGENGSELHAVPAEGEGSGEGKPAEGEGGLDNNGNPVDKNGNLILEKVKSVSDLTDEDFTNPSRNVQLPVLPKNLSDAIGNAKSVIIKKNIFEKNARSHKELTPEDGRKILEDALYSTNVYGQTKPITRPNYWIAIHTGDKNRIVIIEVNDSKDNTEIVGWRYAGERQLKELENQAIGEGGQLLILTPETEAAEGLSTLTESAVSGSKYSNDSGNSNASRQEKSGENNSFGEGFGENNKTFTKDAAEEALKRLLGKLRAGFDPELFRDQLTVAGFVIEGGIRKFADFAKRLIELIGDGIRPYLKSMYEGIRNFPGMESEAKEMTPREEVDKFDIVNFLKEKPATPIETAENTVKAADAEKMLDDLFKSGSFGDKPKEGAIDKNPQHWITYSDKVYKKLLDAVERRTDAPYKSIVELRKEAESCGHHVNKDGSDDVFLQEMTERAIVQAARTIADKARAKAFDPTFDWQAKLYSDIVRLYKAQPTISKRSSDRIALQQYSTPIPMAALTDLFVSNWKAGVSGEVFEPTAGNGALTILFSPGQVTVNEIDETRLGNLKLTPFARVLNYDATKPFTNMGRTFKSVVMNPPFGSTGEAQLWGGKEITGLDPQITLNALETMTDNGKAAIIIGGNIEYKENGSIKTKKPFFTYLYDNYNVKGIIPVSGDLYSRQGTSYPTMMILIDGRRSEADKAQRKIYPPTQEKAPKVVSTFEELYDIVKEFTLTERKTDGIGFDTSDLSSGELPDRTSNHNASGQIEEGGRGEEYTAPGTDAGQSGNLGNGGVSGNRPGKLGGGTGATVSGQTDSTVPVRNTDGDSGDLGSGSERGTGMVQPGQNGARDSGGDLGRVGPDNADGSVGDSGVHPAENDGQNVLTKEKPKEKRTLETKIMSYRPKSKAKEIGSVAPAEMVESMDAAMARIESKKGNIDDWLTEKLGYDSKIELYQALAAEQIDGVANAIYQMENGQSLIIGDQTGVGKGRQIAALIRYAVRNGKKPIFFTKGEELINDIYRDLADIGSGDLRPLIVNDKAKQSIYTNDLEGNSVETIIYNFCPPSKLKKIMETGQVPDEYDYVALSYSQVNTGDEVSRNADKSTRRKKANGKNKRSDAKASWIRAIAKDNYLLLDESHLAAGDSNGAGNTSAFMRSIVADAKGVTFSSATFAKTPGTMPLYAVRTALSDANMETDELIDAVKKGGTPLQEIMSRGLTKIGQLFRRERSSDGMVTDWITIDKPEIVEKCRRNYDATIGVFNDIIAFQENFVNPRIDEIDAQISAMASTAGNKKGTEAAGCKNVPFANTLYNYVKTLLLAIKADSVVEACRAQIEQGKHPVIALENTMESMFGDVEAGGKLEDATFAISLERKLDKIFEYTITDEDGKQSHHKFNIADLGEAAVAEYNRILKTIKEATSDIFISPLDYITEKLNELGYKVGEISGRKTRVVRDEEGDYRVEGFQKSNKNRVVAEFNSGAIDVAIINQSGSTGISLHASEKFEDQRQRCMIIAQALSDINGFMQMIGRTDRTGQVHRGYYQVLSLPIPAEQRLNMMLAAKLRSLNANTTTNQESDNMNSAAVDFLNKYGSTVAYEFFLDYPEFYTKMHNPYVEDRSTVYASGLSDYKTKADDIKKVTGCAALLSVKDQEFFYSEMAERYIQLIDALTASGENDLKIETLPLAAKTISKKVSSPGKNPDGDNPFAQDTYLETCEVNVLKKPLKAEKVKELIDKYALGKDPKERIDQIKDAIDSQKEAKLKKNEENRATALEKAKKRLEAYTESMKASKKDEDEKLRLINEKREKEIDGTNERFDFQEKIITTSADALKARMNRLVVGKTYIVPESLSTNDEGVLTAMDHVYPAIFLGFKCGKDNITPSTTIAQFAVLSGMVKLEIRMNSSDALNKIVDLTAMNFMRARSINLDNWDSEIPEDARETAYILTGNILQAVHDSDGNGKIISYTTDTGEIKDGILLPSWFKPSDLKSSGVPAIQIKDELMDGATLFSNVGNVQIEYNIPTDVISLYVPKSKKNGAKYFQNETLTDLSARGYWWERGGSMMTTFGGYDVDEVLSILNGMNVRFALPEKEENEAKYSLVDDTKDEAIYTSSSKEDKISTIEIAADKFGVDVDVYEGTGNLPAGVSKKARGWFDPKTGKVNVVLSNCRNVDVVADVMLHEAAGHKGLRALFGEDFEVAMQNVYDNAEEGIKATIDKWVNEGRVKDAVEGAEEYISRIGTRGPATEEELTFWQKVRAWLVSMLRKAGIKLRKLTDADMRALFFESKQALKKSRNPFDAAKVTVLKEEAYRSHEEESGDGGNGPGNGGGKKIGNRIETDRAGKDRIYGEGNFTEKPRNPEFASENRDDGRYPGYEDYTEGGRILSQGFGSAGTSLNQVARAFKHINWKEGTTNVDIGGGRFDAATEYLDGLGVTNMVFDPYNRDPRHNYEVAKFVRDNGVDTATVNNVLNVIDSEEARDNVILQAAKALKPGGTAYFSVYEGDKSGQGRQTKSDSWQNNRTTKSYIPEIEKRFEEVSVKDNIITARKPKPTEDKSVWSSDGEYGDDSIRYSLTEDDVIDGSAPVSSLDEIWEYEKQVNNWVNRIVESDFDAHKPLRVLLDVITKKTPLKKGENNPADTLDRTSSKFQYEKTEVFQPKYFKPLLKTRAKIIDKTDLSTEDIDKYMDLKSGLEVQTVYAKRDALAALEAKRKAALAKLAEEYSKDIEDAKSKYDDELDTELHDTLVALEEKYNEGKDDINEYYDAESERVNRGDEEQKDYAKFRKKEYGALRIWFAEYLQDNGAAGPEKPTRRDGETKQQYNARVHESMSLPYPRDISRVEKMAQDEIARLERIIGKELVDELWERTKALTDYNEKLKYEHGLSSRSHYEKLKGTDETQPYRQFYVPLRGFDEDTASDLYAYHDNTRAADGKNETAFAVEAQGRKTKPGSPFKHLGAMHDAYAHAAFQNDAFNDLFDIINSRGPEQQLATISKMWYVKETDEEGNERWVPSYPDVPEGASAEDTAKITSEWKAKMRELKAEGKATQNKAELDLHGAVVYIDKDKQIPQHIIRGRRAGKEYMIIVNGSPRAVAAFKGTNRDMQARGEFARGYGKLLRVWSAASTSWRFAFGLGTNLQRDIVSALTFSDINGAKDFRKKFRGNLLKSFFEMPFLFYNTKDADSRKNPDHKLFELYKQSGAPTGFAYIQNCDEYEKYIYEQLKDDIELGTMVWDKAKSAVRTAAGIIECMEQVSRFAAFKTAIQSGKTVAEAATLAKEITVNFNKRGSLEKISWKDAADVLTGKGNELGREEGSVAEKAGRTTARLMVTAFSEIQSIASRFVPFLGAKSQGIYRFLKFYTNQDTRGKAIGIAALEFFLGFIKRYIALSIPVATVAWLNGDDDDEEHNALVEKIKENGEHYLNMSTYKRHNKAILGLPVPGWNTYLTWAVPQELVPFRGAGDMLAGYIFGDETLGQTLKQTLKEGSGEFLPVNFNTVRHEVFGLNTVLDIMLNEDYKGSKITSTNQWNESLPHWRLGTNYTWDFMVGLTKGLSDMTGGSESRSGWININPGRLQHVVTSLGGGITQDLLTISNTITKAFDESKQITLRDLPIVNRWISAYSDTYIDGRISGYYKFFKEKAKAGSIQSTDAKKRTGDKKAMHSIDTKYLKVYNEYAERIKDDWDRINRLQEKKSTQEEVKEAYRELNAHMTEVVDKCFEIYRNNGKD